VLTTPEEIAVLGPKLAADELGRRWRAALLHDADRLLGVPPVDMTLAEAAGLAGDIAGGPETHRGARRSMVAD
jgi:hypothetical protein